MGLVALAAVLLVLAVAFGVFLVRMVRADGYGYRASSGLPRDWSPTQLPSRPYSATPPH